MKIFIIGTVRNATPEIRQKFESYVQRLESEGHKVHLPHRDTNQQARGIDICSQNLKAIAEADEIHIFYDSKSTGSHFDMGAAFALNKKLKIISNEPFGEGKSFPRMLTEWESR